MAARRVARSKKVGRGRGAGHQAAASQMMVGGARDLDATRGHRAERHIAKPTEVAAVACSSAAPRV